MHRVTGSSAAASTAVVQVVSSIVSSATQGATAGASSLTRNAIAAFQNLFAKAAQGNRQPHAFNPNPVPFGTDGIQRSVLQHPTQVLQLAGDALNQIKQALAGISTNAGTPDVQGTSSNPGMDRLNEMLDDLKSRDEIVDMMTGAKGQIVEAVTDMLESTDNSDDNVKSASVAR